MADEAPELTTPLTHFSFADLAGRHEDIKIISHLIGRRLGEVSLADLTAFGSQHDLGTVSFSNITIRTSNDEDYF